MKRRLPLIVLFAFMLMTFSASAQRIVGYFPSYYTFSLVSPNVRWNCLTDVFYAFAVIDASGNVTIQNTSTFNSVRGQCKPINATGPNLWLSVGGAGQSANFNTVATNSTARANMCTQLANLCTTYNLYGVDIDWEFPTTAQVTNHQTLMLQIHAAMKAMSPQRMTSMAVGGEYNAAIASPTHLDYVTATTLQTIDYTNVMTYDLPAGYNASHSRLNEAQGAANAFKAKGGASFPWSKILIGIPFYGRRNPRDPAGPSETRNYNVETDYVNVYNGTTGLASSGYYYNSKSQMEAKIDWIMAQGGSGVLIWDICQDRATPYNFQDVICARMATACAAPQPNLGADIGVCMPGTISLNSGQTAQAGRTFVWKEDGVVVSGQTGPTFSKATGALSAGNHTYTVEITQSSCMRSDDIVVNLANPVTATGGSRCGTGTVNLNVTSTGGTYEWYDAAVGGTKLFTGSSYTTPSISTTTNYYVQQSTGSSTYYTGKPSTVITNCWNEFASEANPGTRAHKAHKITVSQSLTIQTVDVYTDGTTLSNVRVVAYNSLDGSTVIAQSAPVTLTGAAGVAQTISCNLALDPGTYFVGVFAPNTFTGNAHVWMENVNTPTAFTQAGVFSIEGNCYENNFIAVQTPNHYGQLFNWVIVAGINPPCGRTMVTATVSSGPAQPSVISTNNATPCPASTGVTYSVTNVAGVTYTWSYSGTGATITAGAGTNSITVSYSGGTSGTWTVTPSVSGCNGTARTLAVTISGAAPAQPSVITAGTATPCPTSTGNTYSVTNVAGVTYTWTYSGTGHTITAGAGTNAITVSYASATAGTWTVTPSNACGNGTTRTLAVTLGAVPAQPSTITAGTATPCPTSTGNTYSVTNVAGVTYTWTYSGTGHTITAGAGTNAITVSYTSGTNGTWTVTPSNACGNGTTRTLAVTLGGAVPAQPSAITAGTATPCPTSTGNTYSVTNVAGVTYTWSYSGTGATVTAGAGTNAITVSYASATAGTWTVTPSNACGNGTAQTLAVTLGAVPAQPSTITAGTATPCPTSTGNTYSVTNVAGVTYTWTYSGTGHTITAGAGTNAITVSYASATAGTWTVTPSNACGNGTARTLAVTLGAVPAQPSAITAGTATPCPTSTGNTYSVTNVAGVTYTWTYSGTGHTITAGAGTNAITVSYASATAGTWTVTPSNACGNGTTRTLAVTLGAVPAQPSTITAGTATPCPTSTGNTYSVTNVAGVTYTWTYSGTGHTITAGAGTNAITVSYTSGTNGTWTVTPSNACGNGTTRTLAVTLGGAAPAQPSVITAGTATPCPTSTGNTYSVTNVAGVTYTWTYSGTGHTITAGAGTNAITVSYASATAGTWTVTPSNACGNGTTRTLAVTLGAVPAQPSVITAGTATPCPTSTGNTYSVTNVAGVTYTWTYSGTGHTITAGAGTNAITVSYASATAGTWTVTPSNACGNGTTRTLAVTLGAVPAQPSTITVNTPTPCPTSTGNTYTVTNVAGVTYTWTYSGAGHTITAGAGTNSITVSYTAGTNGTWTVTPSNACGNGTARTLPVTMGVGPAAPSAIVGTTTLTQSTTGNAFSVTNVAGVTYNWTYSGTGGTINNGTTSSITLDLSGSATSGTLSVTATNACGTSSATTVAITVNPATVPQPGAFTTSTAVLCQGATGVVYTVPNVAGTTYNWSYSGTGFTITSGAGTNSIVASFSGSATSGTLSVVAQVGPSTSTPRTMAVTVNAVPAQPSVITPSVLSPCSSSTGNIYTVTNVAGVTYTWAYSGTGHSITSGAGTNTINVTYATGTNGTWSVTPSNACGNGTTRTLAVTMNIVPAQPSVITAGTATPCPTSTGNTYSVTNVAGVTYTWTYSGSGQTITAGAGTNAITVSYASGTNGTWTVTPSNACGNGTTRTLAVTLGGAAPAQPSVITAGTATPCPTSTGNTYSVTNVAGVTYTWTYSGTGHTITAGAGTNAITVSYASATAGTWTVTPSNACGTGTARTLAVTLGAAPAQPSVIGGSATLTQSSTGNAFSVTNVAGVTYNWTYSGTGGTINNGTTSSITLDLSGSATSGTLSVTATNACGTSIARTLAITVNPATVPQPGPFTTSTAVLCQGATGVVYTVPNVAGTTYNWSYSGTGFTITSGAGTNSIVASFSGSATSGTLSVVAQVGPSTSTPRTMAVTVNATPATPGTISGPIAPCTVPVAHTYSVTAVPGATSYTWTLPSGWSGTSTTNSISATPGLTGGNITVVANGTCGTSGASTLAVSTTLAPGTPGGWTGSTTPCAGVSTTYSVMPVSGASGYIWTLPSGWTGTSTTNSITVVPSTTSGTISVVGTSGTCGSSLTPGTLSVSPITTPATPSAIVGTTTLTQGSTGNAFSVTNVAGVTYNWTYSGTGGTINNGTTSSITLDLSGSATSGTLSVTATNACGTSTASTVAITVNSSSTPQPGAFTAGSATVCQGQQGVTYTVPNVAGTTYTWSYTGTDVIINGNTNSITIDFGMTATSGDVSVVANNGSGPSTPRTMSVTVNPIASQPAVITGPSTVSAGQTNLVYFVANQSGVTFNWTYTGANSTITTGQGTNIITIDFSNAATSGNLKVTATGASCGSSLPTSLAITVLPALGVDDAEGVSYDLNVYPNPATSYATIEMNLKNAGKVDLGVYDLLGTEVKVLLKNEMLLSDTYTFSIDDLAYGIYLVKAKSGDETKVIKLIKH